MLRLDQKRKKIIRIDFSYFGKNIFIFINHSVATAMSSLNYKYDQTSGPSFYLPNFAMKPCSVEKFLRSRLALKNFLKTIIVRCSALESLIKVPRGSFIKISRQYRGNVPRGIWRVSMCPP